MNKLGIYVAVVCAISLTPLTAAHAQHEVGDSEFTMALTGDSIITRRLAVYKEPEFLEMIDILRGADMAFTNLEVLFHDYEPYPAATSGGTWMRAEPDLAKDLKWAGFDMVSRANNHTGDYGVLGMQLTTKYVAEAGLIQAGVGNSLAEAREAKFLETAKARVSLISLASTFAKHMGAGRSRDNVKARPGLNPMRYSTTYELPKDKFSTMLETADGLGVLKNQDGVARGYDKEKPNKLRAFGQDFTRGEELKMHTHVHEKDLKEISAVVNNAKRLSDYTIVTMHAHEGPTRGQQADFVSVVAHGLIDAGADVFVGHGPHALRGIEIYKGKPIFYSLGDFMFQNETLLRMPSESYEAYKLAEDSHVADWSDKRYDNDTKGFPTVPEIWEGVIAVPTFKAGVLTALKLHPVDLGFGKPRQVRGRPLLAKGKLAEKIINDLIERSAQYGTKIRFENGIGIVDLD
jgi:poly-gamma-glutamate synthesis protein (capsule biosynthesis protein)